MAGGLGGDPGLRRLADRAGVPFKAQPAEVFAEGSIEDAVLELTSSTSMGADPLGWAKAGAGRLQALAPRASADRCCCCL